MNTANYHVPAISCNHCVMAIKRELGDLAGVSSVEVDPGTKDISVDFESPATQETVENLLDEIGYPVQR